MISKSSFSFLLFALLAGVAVAAPPCDGGCADAKCPTKKPNNSVFVLPKPDTTRIVFTDDITASGPGGCKTVLSRIQKDKRLTIFAALVKKLQLETLLNNPKLVATIIAPSDSAFLKAFSRAGYMTKDDILKLDTSFIGPIAQNHVILNQTVLSKDAAISVLKLETVYTSTNALYMQAYTGRFEAFCFATSTNYTSACASCANKDLVGCPGAVLHIVDDVLIPTAPALPAAPIKPGCSSVYDYISSRADMSDLKAAIDKAGLVKDFNGTRTPGTFFLPVDRAVMTILSINGYPAGRLSAMDNTFITEFLRSHVIRNATLFAAQLITGFTYPTLSGKYILADIHTMTKSASGTKAKPMSSNVAMIWNEEANSTIVEFDIAKCSAVVHIINTPLVPEGFNSLYEAPNLSTYGPFKSVADLLATAPVLSGMYDIIGATPLAKVATSCTTFGTWFLPTNQGLVKMAQNGQSTEALFTNPQKLLDFANYHVIPYSSLPFVSLANGIALKTAAKGLSIKIQKVSNVEGNTLTAEYSVLDQANTASYVNFDAKDLQCGKAIANIVDEPFYSTSWYVKRN